MTGKLTTLTRLSALGHLDLDLLGTGQIGGMNTEATGGDLFDGAVGPVAVLLTFKTAGILAAFAAVRLAADAVHGDRQSLVGFGAKCPERHAGRGEAAADLLDRLDLFDRHRAAWKGDEFQ